MNKLEMAMQMLVAEVRRVGICSIDSEKVADAWKLADAMQAEADKRNKTVCITNYNPSSKYDLKTGFTYKFDWVSTWNT